MKCRIYRNNDEYKCSCGLCWGVDEEDPHDMRDHTPRMKRLRDDGNRAEGRRTLDAIKNSLNNGRA